MAVQMPGMMGMSGQGDCRSCPDPTDKSGMKDGSCVQVCVLAAMSAVLPVEVQVEKTKARLQMSVRSAAAADWIAAPNPSPPRS